MPRTFQVSDSVVVDAPAETIYAQVSDPTQMGRWSPENRGATLAGDWADGARVGTVFDGHNERFGVGWTTRCVVMAADPGERFAFRVAAIGRHRPKLRAPVATWEYRFEPVDDGRRTRVTETWTDDRRRWPDVLANLFDRVVTKGSVFADFQRGNIRRTLAALKSAMESPTAP